MGRNSRDESPQKEFKYDDRLEDVTRALANLGRPSGNFVSGSVFGSVSTFPLPAVQIRRFGEPLEFVHLPFDDAAAQRVIAKCRPALCGHGEETNVDMTVRTTWEVHANHLDVTNPRWETFIREVLDDQRCRLGIAETAQVEIKLSKLAVHEEGGKFERRRDSEQEPGTFGTLVVVLPCAFTGGDLLIHDPAAANGTSFTWWSAGVSAYDVKYAVFYDDCELEAMPVTSGYRLCLMYNLVTTTVEDVPRFAGSSRVQESVERALTEFFAEPLAVKCPKDDRLKTPSTPASHRPLVYVLDHRYWSDGLRFENLKGNDVLVAQSLAKFCDKTNGQYALYLSSLSHEFELKSYDYYKADITVTLENPWVKYGSTRAMKTLNFPVEHLEVVAPSGCLETSWDDCESDDGTITHKWYSPNVLVILPAVVEFELLTKAAPEDVADTLSKLLDAGSTHAHEFAANAFAQEMDWTDSAPACATCLETTMRLGDVSLLFALLKNARGFEFTPSLRDAIVHFGWDQCLPALLATGQKVPTSSRINLTASVLHGEIDPARIATILDAWDATLATVEAREPISCSSMIEPRPTADEFARVLTLAYRVSHDTLVRHLCTSNDDTFVNLLVPAFRTFVATLPTVDTIMGAIHLLRDQLQARLPALRNAGFSRVKVDHDCAKCQVIQAFLSSDTQEKGTIVDEDESKTGHLQFMLRHIRMDGASSLKFAVVTPSTIEMTKLFGEDKHHQEALRALEGLETLCQPSTTDAVQPTAEAQVDSVQLAAQQPPQTEPPRRRHHAQFIRLHPSYQRRRSRQLREAHSRP